MPFEMVDEALAATRAMQRRVRDLPSPVVVYLLLACRLFPEPGYPGVWRKPPEGLAGLPVAAPCVGAPAQAPPGWRAAGLARRRVGAPPWRGAAGV